MHCSRLGTSRRKLQLSLQVLVCHENTILDVEFHQLMSDVSCTGPSEITLEPSSHKLHSPPYDVCWHYSCCPKAILVGNSMQTLTFLYFLTYTITRRWMEIEDWFGRWTTASKRHNSSTIRSEMLWMAGSFEAEPLCLWLEHWTCRKRFHNRIRI